VAAVADLLVVKAVLIAAAADLVVVRAAAADAAVLAEAPAEVRIVVAGRDTSTSYRYIEH
jgi:hypothetical protein